MSAIGFSASQLLDRLIGGAVPAGFGGTFADFAASLQPSSFRGVPFGVTLGESRFGRSLALHEYPFRDTQWAEDLGRGTRQFTIQGFLISDSLIYGGGDITDQRTALIGAAETKGKGTLIHPTLGRLQVSIPEGGLIITDRLDAGNFLEFSLACYETGERTFPASASDASDDSEGAADSLDSASGADFISRVADAVRFGAQVVNMGVLTATSWVGILNVAAADATGIFNMVASLPGSFGRFFNGALAGYAQALVGPAIPVTLESLVFSGTQARASVAEAGLAFIATCHEHEPDGPPAAAQAAGAALLAATVNPADAVRLFAGLSNFYPGLPTGDSVTAAASGVMQTAMGALLRRTALAAMVRASNLYQPQSEDDANQVRVTVCGLLEQEAVTAGDNGDDSTYAALIAARGAVAADLGTRGAQLPPMRQFNLARSFPSLVVGQMLYQDSARADQLVQEANPRHPAFMPATFKALSS